jgi:hypothetical protein
MEPLFSARDDRLLKDRNRAGELKCKLNWQEIRHAPVQKIF